METLNERQLDRLQHDFISALHILHYHDVLDAYGHLSVRNPLMRDTFIMSRNMAPALVSGADDLITLTVDGARPTDPSNQNQLFSERFIHSEIYKQHPDVNAVVHSHCQAVLPFTINRVRLRPVIHLGGFLRPEGCPVFDTRNYEGMRLGPTHSDNSTDDGSASSDLLVKDEFLGRKLAYKFIDTKTTVVLMRGHGFTTVAPTLQTVVFRAIYTAQNVAVQKEAIMMQNAAMAVVGTFPMGADPGIHFLSKGEAAAASEMCERTVKRPWDLWVREVEVCPLYQNSA
ncbi:class II aldolase and Adducin N-terminal domain-containing protein [Triangularia verruculosa]|uniref:Class II aldolase and Adducin N-terminal domain-containing protein n=1 Tax=Triangularia verruculosa TaxID=2587418 RepID=A0AAN7AT43_9PEZI|nr:class II aldolase and Adducin N-terminal domain-containing protein [Triangularia verruculosa]